jgi:hypothetical protein
LVGQGRQEEDVSWRRIVALGVPLAVLVSAMGVIVGLEVQRGPNWRLELDEYVAQQRSLGESVSVQTVVRARRPWNFTAAMATAEPDDWIRPSFPPQAVRCALLVRHWTSDEGVGDESVRQILFLAHHSDALYHVDWLAYEGPEEPFGPEVAAHLERIGCDLRLD